MLKFTYIENVFTMNQANILYAYNLEISDLLVLC
jgi:hypothetical protein